MRGFWAWLTLAVALLSFPLDARAQGAIQQSGPIVPFHAPAWFQNGVQGDAGTPQSPFIGAFGLFNGPSCPFGVSSQTSPGTSFSPSAAFSICQTATATTFNFQGVNGASAPTVNFNIGGTIFPFPPSGIPVQTVQIQAAQNITADTFIHITSGFQMVPASAATGLSADGFVIANVNIGTFGAVYLAGVVTGFSGLTGGSVYLSSSGGATSTPPASGSGLYVQRLGIAVSSSSVNFNPSEINGPV